MQSSAFMPPRPQEGWSLYCAIGSLLCLFFIVNAYYTPIAVWPIAGHDDGHFLRQGLQISRGQWLGVYDQMTLIKGPGFPLFLALGRFSHLPFPIFLALFQAGSFFLVSAVVGYFAGSSRLALILLGALLTFPWIWSPPLNRVLRESIYTPQILVFFALLFLVLWGNLKRSWLVPALAGLMLGWISITREETPWLYPIIGLLIALSLFVSWRSGRPVRILAVGVISMAIGFGAVRAAISTTNYVKYGTFEVTDIDEANFRRALGALFSVGGAEQIDHIPLPRHSREALYTISPTFAELSSLLDGKDAPLSGWQHAGCGAFGGPACQDYAYPWVMWAFRDAVAAKGHYKNARTAAEFYRAVASEIEPACGTGKLACRYSPLAEMPPPVPGNFERMLSYAARGLEATAMLGRQAPDRMDSLGPPDMIAAAQAFLNGALVERARLRPQDPPAEAGIERRTVDAARIIQKAIKNIYRVIWPAACAILVLLLPIATLLAIRRGRLDYVLLIAWTFTALAAARILLLSFMSGYMFDAIQFEYLTPAPYALIVAVIACSYSTMSAIRGWNV